MKKKDRRLSLRMPKDLYNDLSDAADKRAVSINAHLNIILFNHNERKKKREAIKQ